MKIYTSVFDVSRPSPQRFWVAPHSDFKIGIKLADRGQALQDEFVVRKGDVELTPDETGVGGFAVYTLKSGAPGPQEYVVEVASRGQKFLLTQVTTNSTVFESDEKGSVPADVATQGWVESRISGFAEESELSDYAQTADLSAFYAKSETSSATEIGTALEGKQPTGNYLTAETDPAFNAWLSGDSVGIGYHTQTGTRTVAVGFAAEATDMYSVAVGGPNCKAQAYCAIQLGAGTNNVANTFKVFNYPMLSTDGKIPNERLHLSAVSESDWATLSGTADAGTFYFVY